MAFAAGFWLSGFWIPVAIGFPASGSRWLFLVMVCCSSWVICRLLFSLLLAVRCCFLFVVVLFFVVFCFSLVLCCDGLLFVFVCVFLFVASSWLFVVMVC